MTWLQALAPDEVEFFRATVWVRRGLLPYRDFWEHHTPLQWILFAPFTVFAKGPGISGIVVMRWWQVPLWVITFVLVAVIGRRMGSSGAAVALAVLLAVSSPFF